MTPQEKALLSLTSELESVETNKEKESSESYISYPLVQTTEVGIEDIRDLKSKSVLPPLTDIDYLVLTDYSLGMTQDNICQKHNISKAKLSSLLRNPKAIELVEDLTENTRKKSLATATALESKGIELLNIMVNTNIENGNYDTALKLLFGKLSLTEVTERIAKRGNDEKENPTVQINQLFTDLTGR